MRANLLYTRSGGILANPKWNTGRLYLICITLDLADLCLGVQKFSFRFKSSFVKQAFTFFNACI